MFLLKREIAFHLTQKYFHVAGFLCSRENKMLREVFGHMTWYMLINPIDKKKGEIEKKNFFVVRMSEMTSASRLKPTSGEISFNFFSHMVFYGSPLFCYVMRNTIGHDNCDCFSHIQCDCMMKKNCNEKQMFAWSLIFLVKAKQTSAGSKNHQTTFYRFFFRLFLIFKCHNSRDENNSKIFLLVIVGIIIARGNTWKINFIIIFLSSMEE